MNRVCQEDVIGKGNYIPCVVTRSFLTVMVYMTALMLSRFDANPFGWMLNHLSMTTFGTWSPGSSSVWFNSSLPPLETTRTPPF